LSPTLVPASTHLVLPVFNLTATPEAATHGAFVQQLKTRSPAECVAVVDETAFRERWSGEEARLLQRREAWRDLFAATHVPCLFLHLAALDLEPGMLSLQQALEQRAA